MTQVYNAVTTLNEIRKHNPCRDGWEKLLKHLGKTGADDDPLRLSVILDSNGFDDAVWCLRAESLERLSRHFQAWCAEQVLHIYEAAYPGDARVREHIAMLRNDDATALERRAARAAASDAASDAVWAAASDAAWAAARAAAWEAAWDAARNATSDAAWDAAWNAARERQAAQLRLMIGETK